MTIYWGLHSSKKKLLGNWLMYIDRHKLDIA